MGSYYRNAILTIAVDDAAGDIEGFLHTIRPSAEAVATIPSKWGQKRSNAKKKDKLRSESGTGDSPSAPNSIYLRRLFAGPQNAPRQHLSERAWTLQESLLSPRMVHYSSEQLVWECQKCILSESGLDPRLHVSDYYNKKLAFLHPGEDMRRVQGSKIAVRRSVVAKWYNIVAVYTTRALTFPNDRFPALAGIAQEVAKQLSWSYKAGLWVEDLHRGLIWSYRDGAKSLAAYRAPSFSWGALDGESGVGKWSSARGLYYDELLYPGHTMWILNMSKPMVVVKEFEVEPLDGDPYGRLKTGHMKLSSYWIHSSHWEGDISSLFHINGYGEHSRSYIRGSYLEYKVLGDEEVICTFDEPPPASQEARDALCGVSFLQIGYWNGWQNRTSRMVLFALMLKQARAKPEGTFVRVGIAEFPFPKHARFESGPVCGGPPTAAQVDATYRAFEDGFDKVSTEECQYRDPEGFGMDSWEMTDVIIV